MLPDHILCIPVVSGTRVSLDTDLTMKQTKALRMNGILQFSIKIN